MDGTATTEVRYTSVATATLTGAGNIALSWPAVKYPAWRASFEYVNGSQVDPGNGHKYAAQNFGVSGTVQPTFPTGAGATVVDNGVTWKESGSSSFAYNYYSNNALAAPLFLVGTTAVGATSVTISAPMTLSSTIPTNNTGNYTSAAFANHTANNLVVDSSRGDQWLIDLFLGPMTINSTFAYQPVTNSVTASKYGHVIHVNNGSGSVTFNGLYMQASSPNQDDMFSSTGGGNGNQIVINGGGASPAAGTHFIFNVGSGNSYHVISGFDTSQATAAQTLNDANNVVTRFANTPLSSKNGASLGPTNVLPGATAFPPSTNNAANGTVTVNAGLGNFQKLNMNGNVTSWSITNPIGGQFLTLQWCGNFTVSGTPASVRGFTTVSNAGGGCTQQTFWFDGTNWYATAAGTTNL